ncbi:hypothetical protein GGQ79_004711 [Ochrobactrum pecoris]|uniref:Uncharacterized protein n=1 Tax=Brucella pecoris TaxID=867683 RepID=A0AB34YZD3_9HYPH|nr:hypothetical protein [Brucella pecoris]
MARAPVTGIERLTIKFIGQFLTNWNKLDGVRIRCVLPCMVQIGAFADLSGPIP